MPQRNKIPEKYIQKSILQYLNIRGYVCKRNNAGMARDSYHGKERFFKVGEAGWPDIEGITNKNHQRGSGVYFGIEVKSEKGILSQSQRWIGQRILDTNGIYFIARNLDDVIAKGF